MTDTNSSAAAGRAAPILSEAKLKQLYTLTLQCRLLAQYAQLRGKRNGASLLPPPGFEAAAAGCAADLLASDRIASSRLGFLHAMAQGAPPGDALAQMRSIKAPVGLDAEAALQEEALQEAARQKLSGGVVVVFLNESLAPWLDALRFAGRRSLPILFVVRQEEPAPPLRFPAIPVDAQDVVAVYRVAHETIKRARLGCGPTLIECKRSPLSAGSGKRDSAAVAEEEDSLLRLERYMARRMQFRKAWKNRLRERISGQLEKCSSRFPERAKH